MAYHLNFIHPTGWLPYWAAWLWVSLTDDGYLGVSVFFVISGFLITRMMANQEGGLANPYLRDFYSRRVGRLFPLLTLVCLIGAWLIYHAPPETAQYLNCIKAPDVTIGLGHWLAILTFTFNWYVSLLCYHPYQGLQWDILWSLSIEEQFYLFYPLILRKFKKESALIGLSIYFIIFGLVIRCLYVSVYKSVLSYNSFQNFDMIALGCLLYVVWNRFQMKLRAKFWVCLGLCLFGLCLAGLVYIRFSSVSTIWYYWFGRFGIGVGASFFLLGAMSRGWFESNFFKVFALPGKLSYGMYLWHPLVLYFLWNFLKVQNLWIGFISFALATTLVGYISYRFFEMPMNFWVRKQLSGERSKGF